MIAEVKIDNTENYQPDTALGVELTPETHGEFRLEILSSLSETFLEQMGIDYGKRLTFEIVGEERFSSAYEHFSRSESGTIYLKDSFYDKVNRNGILLTSIVVHELFHDVKQGFNSYAKAIELINAFSVSDILRIDLEADVATYRFLQKEIGINFEEYCASVMLPYPDLFGVKNKGFSDFSRYCGKLFNLGGIVGELELGEKLIVLAPDRSGWIQTKDNTLIKCQIIDSQGSRFSEIEMPNSTVDSLSSIFWRNNRKMELQEIQSEEMLIGHDSIEERAYYCRILSNAGRDCKLI